LVDESPAYLTGLWLFGWHYCLWSNKREHQWVFD